MFEAKFIGKQQEAFQRMSYALFCSKFNIRDGIFSYKNQIGIETEPIEINGNSVGFQAKYLEPSTSFSSKKNTLLKSLENAKIQNPRLSLLLFYVNKSFPESSIKGKKTPKYIDEIYKKADTLGVRIEWQVPSLIEKQLSLSSNLEIAKEFFPDFHDLHKHEILSKDRDQMLNVTKTAIIQLEIEKIKEGYYKNDWDARETELSKLYRFTDHTNETIASSIFDFLSGVADQTRSNMPSEIASEIFSLVLTFYPSSYDEEFEERMDNAKRCVHIGYNLVYDAFIYSSNFRIAQFGLNIWKFIYREAKRNNVPELYRLILKQYEDIERTLSRPSRPELEKAKQLVKLFKNDLDTYSLSFPVIPDDLYSLFQKSK